MADQRHNHTQLDSCGYECPADHPATNLRDEHKYRPLIAVPPMDRHFKVGPEAIDPTLLALAERFKIELNGLRGMSVSWEPTIARVIVRWEGEARLKFEEFFDLVSGARPAEGFADDRKVLAQHFVMWHDAEGERSPEWRCSCGLRFLFSDTAISHQADMLAQARAAGGIDQ